MAQIRGIILDMDGTLIDSNDAHARSWVEAMEEAGFEPRYREIRRLIGMGGDFLIPEALGIEAGSEKGKRIGQRRKEIFRERFLPDVTRGYRRQAPWRSMPCLLSMPQPPRLWSTP